MAVAMETSAADLRGWLARLDVPPEAAASLLGLSRQTLDRYVEQERAPRVVLIAAERVEQEVLGTLGPRLAPPLESGHPKVAEAARLMREAAEVSDPADLYEIEDIVAAVPAMLVDALPDLRLADKRVVRSVLAAMEGEGAEQDAWRAWRSAELLRRLAIMLCAVARDSEGAFAE